MLREKSSLSIAVNLRIYLPVGGVFNPDKYVCLYHFYLKSSHNDTDTVLPPLSPRKRGERSPSK